MKNKKVLLFLTAIFILIYNLFLWFYYGNGIEVYDMPLLTGFNEKCLRLVITLFQLILISIYIQRRLTYLNKSNREILFSYLYGVSGAMIMYIMVQIFEITQIKPSNLKFATGLLLLYFPLGLSSSLLAGFFSIKTKSYRNAILGGAIFFICIGVMDISLFYIGDLLDILDKGLLAG